MIKYLKGWELVVTLVDAEGEEQARIASIDYLVIPELYRKYVMTSVFRKTYLKEISMFILSLNYLAVHFDLYFPSFAFVVSHVPPRQASLPLSILQ